MRARRAGVALGTIGTAMLLATMACGPSLDPPSVVERTRVVAARITPVSDPARAWPLPGEALVIDWVVVTPGAPEPLAAVLVACAPLPGTMGTAACAEGSLVPLAPRAPSTDPFRTELTAPTSPGSTSGGPTPATSFLVSGAVCVGGGVPSLAAEGAPRCVGGPEETTAELLVLEISLAADAESANRHPTLADEAWTLAGDAWDAPTGDAPLDGCADVAGTAALPRVSRSDDAPRNITLEARADDRETYVDAFGETRREVLEISHFATAGEMERTFSAVDDTTTSQPPIEIDWELPAEDEVPESGLLVRFTAVVRDGRSGVDRAERVACVVP